MNHSRKWMMWSLAFVLPAAVMLALFAISWAVSTAIYKRKEF